MSWIWQSDVQGIVKKTVRKYTLIDNPVSLATNAFMVGPEAIYFRAEYLNSYKDIFSKRELEVLKLTALGFNAEHISRRLFISKYTVDTHRKNMIHKIEANNTAHLIGLSQDLGLI